MTDYTHKVRKAAAIACRAIHQGCACEDFGQWQYGGNLCESRLIAAEAAYVEAGREVARLTAERDKAMSDANEADARVVAVATENCRLRKGIQDILDGNYPHARTYRPGKCPHGIWFYEDCGVCTDEALQAVLNPPPL